MRIERLIPGASSAARYVSELAALVIALACAGCANTPFETPSSCCASRERSPANGLNALLIHAVPEKDRGESPLIGVSFTDQHGTRHDQSDLVGKPLALSFIYTRCENPARCPTITKSMAALQERIETSGLGDKVNVALVSFDPEFDTPEKLSAYAEGYGLGEKRRLLLLAPDPLSSTGFFKRIKMPVNYERSGRPNGHGTLLLLLDKQGRVAERREVSIGEPGELYKSLAALVTEK